MSFKPIQKLNVTRTLSSGEQVSVGVLAQNRQGVFFQYTDDYLQQFGNLSPFTLQANTLVQAAPKAPHQGVHGVFERLFARWLGHVVTRSYFPAKGILPNQLTAMDKLAFVGDKGMGALSFAPVR